jgi:hypothetical protein
MNTRTKIGLVLIVVYVVALVLLLEWVKNNTHTFARYKADFNITMVTCFIALPLWFRFFIMYDVQTDPNERTDPKTGEATNDPKMVNME